MVFVIIGILGNISALTYFWPERHSSTPNKLYICIMLEDIMSALFIIPLAISLFSNRQPLPFAGPYFCELWTIGSIVLVRMSMFMVAVMSVTRTIAIVRPFFEIKWSTIVKAMILYAACLLAPDVIFSALDWLHGHFYASRCSCSYILTDKIPSWARNFVLSTVEIEVMLPSIVVFISFVISVVSLTRRKDKVTVHSEKKFRDVSVTITLFTAVFLMCNTPFFVFQLLYTIAQIDSSFKAKVTSDAMRNYGLLLFLYVPYIQNTALNPIVYFLRMPKYKQRCISLKDTIAQRSRQRLRESLFLRKGTFEYKSLESEPLDILEMS